MKVEIWSDVVCRWCYIGKRNLEAALAVFEHGDESAWCGARSSLNRELPPFGW